MGCPWDFFIFFGNCIWDLGDFFEALEVLKNSFRFWGYWELLLNFMGSSESFGFFLSDFIFFSDSFIDFLDFLDFHRIFGIFGANELSEVAYVILNC